MEEKPAIESILILTGSEYPQRASLIFKKYFFDKNRSIELLLSVEGLNKVWVKDKKTIDELNAIVDKRNVDFKAKNLESSAKLKEQEWALVGKLSEVKDDFSFYTNRSGAIIEHSRVYLAFREPKH